MLVNKGNIIPENLEGDKRVVKFNIPENHQNYLSGNGEGCWGYIEDDETFKMYDEGIGEFEIILLNHCFEYPELEWGTVCIVEGKGDNRPVVKWDWLKDNVKVES